MAVVKKILCFMLFSLWFVGSIQADGKVEKILTKIQHAYGGDAITSMKTLRLKEHQLVLGTGQSVSTKFTDVHRNSIKLVIDFENDRRRFLEWNDWIGFQDLYETRFENGRGTYYHHSAKNYSDGASVTFDNVGMRAVRNVDLLLVQEMIKQRETVELEESVFFNNTKHHVLWFEMNTGSKLKLYVDAQSGLVSKMFRYSDYIGEMTYTYSRYMNVGAFTYASDMSFSVGGQPEVLVTQRNLEIDVDVSTEFVDYSHYAPHPETIDTSKVLVKKLSDNVFYAGSGGEYSIFVKADNGYVVSGGGDGLKSRLTAVNELASTQIPITHFVFTHHHGDHLGALTDLADMPVTIVLHKEHYDYIKDRIESETVKFQIVEDTAELHGGVKLYSINLIHSDEYLLFHVPSDKIVFSEDQFYSTYKTALPNATGVIASFRDALDVLDIEVEHLVAAHAPRIFTRDELNAVADRFDGGKCPEGFTVCQ